MCNTLVECGSPSCWCHRIGIKTMPQHWSVIFWPLTERRYFFSVIKLILKIRSFIVLIKGTQGFHIHSAHFLNFDLTIVVIHRIDSFLWLFLLEFFYRRTVRSQRERECWTLFRPAALHPGMSVPHRNLFPYQSVWDLWHFGADPDLWLMDPDPTPFFNDFKDAKQISFSHIFFL